MGFDDYNELGNHETGSRAAAPIWLEFMKEVLRDKEIEEFPVPEGIVFVKIDKKTGLLPTPESATIIFESFKEGTAPTEYSDYTEKPNAADFFRLETH